MTTSDARTDDVPDDPVVRVEARRNIPLFIIIGIMGALFIVAAGLSVDGHYRGSSVASAPVVVPAARPPS